MSSTITIDTSPASILRSLRGKIVAARIAYPEVLHVEVRDEGGGMWRLATQDARFSPTDPSALIGRGIESAEIDHRTGTLRCSLSDGSCLSVQPASTKAHDDPPSWELITPGGAALEFGPGLRWQIASAAGGR